MWIPNRSHDSHKLCPKNWNHMSPWGEQLSRSALRRMSFLWKSLLMTSHKNERMQQDAYRPLVHRRSGGGGGCSIQRVSLQRPPWTENPPGQRPLQGTWHPPQGYMGPGSQKGMTTYRPMNRMTHTSENIALPQTSFAGRNQCSWPFNQTSCILLQNDRITCTCYFQSS